MTVSTASPLLFCMIVSVVLLLQSRTIGADDCQPPPADFVFIVDGTINVGVVNFKKIKTFVKNFVAKMTIGIGNKASRVGLLQFTPR